MRKLFSLFAAVLFAGSIMADSFTITFKDCGEASDSNSSLTSTNVADYVAEGAEHVTAVSASGKVYNAATGYGLKFGNSSNPGAVTLTLAGNLNLTSIVMSASQYAASEGSGLLQDSTINLTNGGGKGKFVEYTYTYDEPTKVTTLIVGTKTKRGYVKSVTVNYEAGKEVPATAIELDKAELELTPFLTATLKATLTPAEATTTVEWLSTDEKVVVVTSGTVVAKAPGTAFIVASAGEGISDTCVVLVKEPELISCAEAAKLAKDEVAYLNPVQVTYVNGQNIYVQDSTGAALIYGSLGLKAGQFVGGFVGTSSPFNGLPELKPLVTLADLDTLSAEAPAPEELKKAPKADEINKYLVLKGVQFKDTTFASSKNVTAVIGGEEFIVRNNFGVKDVKFDTLKTYDVVGCGAVYVKDETTTYQFYFVSATEAVGPDSIIINFDSTALGQVDNQYYAKYGETEIMITTIPANAQGYLEGDGLLFVLNIYPEDPNNISGLYSADEDSAMIDLEYTYLLNINGTDTAEVAFVHADALIVIGEFSKEEKWAELGVKAQLEDLDGNAYAIQALLTVYYDFVEEQGIEDIEASEKKVIKKIEMGNLIIEKNGVKYNVVGTRVR